LLQDFRFYARKAAFDLDDVDLSIYGCHKVEIRFGILFAWTVHV
jgi:hypothetical protein